MLLVSYFVVFSIHEGAILSFFLQGLYQRLAFITIYMLIAYEWGGLMKQQIKILVMFSF